MKQATSCRVSRKLYDLVEYWHDDIDTAPILISCCILECMTCLKCVSNIDIVLISTIHDSYPFALRD